MAEVRRRYDYALAQDAEDRRPAVEDSDFVAGAQWSAEDIKARSDPQYPRPILTENRLPTFVAQVSNDGRQNKPAIKCSVMDGGKKETAEFFQSRIRHIEYDSDADIAYDDSRDSQIICGRGFYRVTTEIDATGAQQIRIKPIENQFSVLFDPAAREYDRSDADWCFVITLYSREAFRRRFGVDAAIVQSGFYEGTENPAPSWVGAHGSEQIQVAEYWEKDYAGEKPIIRQYVIDGVEIHDETEWLGSCIPIIPVWGRQQIQAGKRRTFSLVRNAKDPQRLVNLYVSNIAEQIALMPKSPYMIADGQIAGYEDEWESINTVPRAVVRYKATSVGGTQVGQPSRIQQEPPIQALVIGYNQAVDAMKAAMGIYDTSLGARSNESSGIAIQRRQKEADNANFHFHDNEARSRRHLGRILIELIPLIDAGEKAVPIRSEDGKSSIVRVNTAQPYPDPETGKPVQHDLASGSYGVSVSTGPSFTSARQEAFEVYSQIASADPRFMQIAGDVLFRNMDAPGADQIAERYEKTLPPQLAPQKGQQAQIPPQVQQTMQLMSQQHEQLVATVHQLQDEIDTKKAELESRERIASMQEETKRTIALASLSQNEGLQLLRNELEVVKLDVQHRHQAMQQQGQQEYQATLQQSQQDAAREAAETAAQQAAEQQETQPESAEVQIDGPAVGLVRRA